MLWFLHFASSSSVLLYGNQRINKSNRTDILCIVINFPSHSLPRVQFRILIHRISFSKQLNWRRSKPVSTSPDASSMLELNSICFNITKPQAQTSAYIYCVVMQFKTQCLGIVILQKQHTSFSICYLGN